VSAIADSKKPFPINGLAVPAGNPVGDRRQSPALARLDRRTQVIEKPEFLIAGTALAS